MFRIIAHGPFAGVACGWVGSSRLIVPEVEAVIETAWQQILGRPGVTLFDGPVCRLESITVQNTIATITISQTSYKVIVGTHFANPGLADIYGPDVLANPLGVSTALLTGDGFIMLGVRNHTVAYYPGRVHPFAGSVEVCAEVDLHQNARRELFEELALSANDLIEVICLGFAEDTTLRHPEALFLARTPLSRAQIESQTDKAEHTHAWHIRCDAPGIARALSDTQLTPIAKAALFLSGRMLIG
jgi:8-oxo-dGTP pyrophosphatase MutT (NUDIX family)